MANSSKGLKKSLNLLETIALGVSDVSPVTGLFVMAPVLIAGVGTGSITVVIIAGFIALCVALSMGELGSIFPLAGGIYSIIRKVLGRTTGFISLVLYLSQGIFIPSVVALGCATYICNIFPSFNVNIVAVVVMALATIIAILNISSGAKFTTILLAIELLVVGIMTVASLFHTNQSPSVLFDMQVASDSGGLAGVGPGLIFALVSVMLFSFNGYDSALTFSEESKGEAKNVGKSVVRTAITGIIAQLIPIAAIFLAAPNIKTLLTSDDPMTYIGHHILGTSFDMIINVGAAIAMFACTIAVLLQFSRVLYTSGRDGAWPEAISNAFSAIHSKFQTPWISSIVLGVLGAALCFLSNLNNLITFTSVVIVLLYALIALCSFVVHLKHKELNRPYKIPLWPLPPAIAIIGAVVTLTQQTAKDLLVVACIIVVSALYYAFYLSKKETQTADSETTVVS